MIARYFFLLSLTTVLCTCGSAPNDELVADEVAREKYELSGRAMGTYYRITYLGDSLAGLQAHVDSVLEAYNQELSAWVPGSKLNAFNQSEAGIDLAGTRHFIPNLQLAQRVWRQTGGAYDPTIGPLVTYWGFGTGQQRTSAAIDSAAVAQLAKLVDFDLVELDGTFLKKRNPKVQLDLNASAKGYGVDLIADWLKQRGRPNHLVDIGGELRSGGNNNGSPWTVAIRLPDEDKRRITRAGVVALENDRAIATSGNYLNYYRVDSTTFSHTINPETGFIERNRLLSASIFAPDCATADAYATASLVLGPERALALVEGDPDLEAYLIVQGEDGAPRTIKSSGL